MVLTIQYAGARVTAPKAIKLIAYTEHVGWRSRAMTSGSSSFSWRLSALTAIEISPLGLALGLA